MKMRKIVSLRSEFAWWTTIVLIGLTISPESAAFAQTIAASQLPKPVAPKVVDPTPAKKIEPNRTVPSVTPPVFAVRFSDTPLAEEITRARVLPEPLQPVASTPTISDNRAVARALTAFAASSPNVSPLEDFITENPDSPWKASVLTNLGVLRFNAGYYSRAARYWDEAWTLAKDHTDPSSRSVADFAVAEWLTEATAFGNVDGMQARFAEIEGRPIFGAAATKVSKAREGLSLLVTHHELATFSGPEALKALIGAMGKRSPTGTQSIGHYHPGHDGTSLTTLRELGMHAGVSLSMRFISKINDLPLPAIVHLKSNHYSAVIARNGNAYTLRDPILGGDIALSADALRDESSGYVLVPEDHAADVGRAVTSEEGDTVVGHCAPGGPYDDDQCGCGGPSTGMPTYVLHPMTTSVLLTDTPLTYTPPVGPAMDFTLRYNQRSTRVDNTPTYGNVGPKWTLDWYSYVSDNNNIIVAPYSYVTVVLRGEGSESYNSYSGFTHWKTRASLVKVSDDPVRWERRLPDGTVEVYASPDRAASLPNRKTFLTQVIDPQGHTLSYTYDSSMRLVAATDSVGQVSTFEYLDASHPLLMTKMTDPFGRTALLTYNAPGELASITDAVGMTSTFAYDSTGAMVAMTTPYGTTTFRYTNISSYGSFRRTEATDPEGDTERIEYHVTNSASLPSVAPANEVPEGFTDYNGDLEKYNSLYWNKQAMAEAPGDVSHAVITHWLLASEMAYVNHAGARNIPHSIKKPLESRVWYAYPNQASGGHYGVAGTGTDPTMIARVLDDGTSQITQSTYNTQGQALTRIEPMGRRTLYTYDANGIDLLEVRNTTGTLNDLLAQYANYTAGHQPLTMTDAAGQTTTFTYNAAEQVLTLTNPKQETTSYAYNADGQLISVTGPVTGATTTYTYDVQGRIHSVTDADGYTVTTDYDALNRPTRVTYSDGTYEETTYNRLDRATSRDRLGRVTRYYYDALGRLVSTRDPLGRVVRQEWCTCGTLARLIDADGHATTWEHDQQGRVTRELRADGHATQYIYEGTTTRLKSVTDPKLQTTSYTYFADDKIKDTLFTNEQIPTPDVSFTYDATYGRLATMVDGTGTTTYSYHPIGIPGATKLASVDGPLTNDTITYTYDELGRVTNRAMNGVGVTWAFDALGRVTSEANVLGTFAYTYDGVMSRLETVTYPNGQTSAYSYFGNSSDHRLQTIHHRYPSGATLSKFDYTYNATGNIITWRQQADTAAVMWTYDYDVADQLVAAVKRGTDPQTTLLQRYAYAYDPAGNRTVEQIGDLVTGTTYNSVNELVSEQPSGAMQFAGTVSEPAEVTIAGIPAVVAADNHFQAAVPVSGGTNTVSVSARDASGNTNTQQFQLANSGGTQAFTYDANGNLISDGAQTYEWDACNRLVRVLQGTTTIMALAYDGRGMRQQKTEGGVTHRYVYDAGNVIQESLSTGTTISYVYGGVDKPIGQRDQAGNVSYFVADRLGNITETTDQNGSITLRRAYDPWGNQSEGSTISGFSYTGREWDAAAGLYYYRTRYYSSSIGRFLSDDTIGLRGGTNLYAYVQNNPINRTDPNGTTFVDCAKALAELILATAVVNRRVLEIQAYGGDPGHIDALEQAMNRLENALAKVKKHCGCALGVAAAIAAAELALEEAAPYLLILAVA